MRRHSAEDKFNIFYYAAAISVHANAGSKSFRQKDFSFFLDLVSNWACLDSELVIHNAQALRFLKKLSEDGFAKKTVRGKTPYYRLTRLGLLELVSLMVHNAEERPAQEFYFLFYFVSSYRSKIESLIAAEGKQFPSALRLEILALLDAEELLRRQIRKCDTDLEKIDSRIRETLAGARLFEEQRRIGKSVVESAEILEKRYPYQLNSLKPLSKLISEIPTDIGETELTINSKRRAEMIFSPKKQFLLRHRENLRQLMR
jgi:DNA-binding PadR family transcriptional regulator